MKTVVQTNVKPVENTRSTKCTREERRLAAIARLERYGAVFNKDKTRILRVIPM